jgi:hypothetical protein
MRLFLAILVPSLALAQTAPKPDPKLGQGCAARLLREGQTVAVWVRG